MPELRRDLEALVRIPSVSVPGRIDAAAARRVRDDVAPVRRGGRRGRTGSTCPTPRRSSPARSPLPRARRRSCSTATTTSSRRATRRCGPRRRSSPPSATGRSFGRGAADTKSNIIAHVGALRAWGGRPPVGIKLCIEGYEEIGSGALTRYPPTDPARFQADALVIGDMGSIRPGLPTLTTALRGMANVTRRGAHAGVRQAQRPVRRRRARRPARPPARARLAARRARRRRGRRAAAGGVGGRAAAGGGLPRARHRPRRHAADRHRRPRARGSGRARRSPSSASTCRRSTAPSTPSRRYARAALNVRVHPEQDAAEAQDAVMRHLRAQRPVRHRARRAARPDRQRLRGDDRRGPAYDAARAAWSAAWGRDVMLAGSGGSIPIVSALAQALPDAEALLVGATDGFANIHGPDERLLLSEFENADDRGGGLPRPLRRRRGRRDERRGARRRRPAASARPRAASRSARWPGSRRSATRSPTPRSSSSRCASA